MPFEKKQLAPPKRVCLRLKEARESKKLSLDELAKITKLNKRHLIALEECRFDDIPYAVIYQKNFIRSYAHAVGIPPEPLLEQFLVEETPTQKSTTNICVKKTKLRNFPYVVRSVVVSAFILVFFIYLGLQVKAMVEPPTLTLYTPDDGFVTSDNSITIRGKTEAESSVKLNGKNIQTDEYGYFQESIALSSGINTLTIRAHKRHGKEISETRHVVVRETPQQFSLNR
jgi:cytoskeletal protein RodZ